MDEKKISAALLDYLDEFNSTKPSPMHLVFFQDAISHLTRIWFVWESFAPFCWFVVQDGETPASTVPVHRRRCCFDFSQNPSKLCRPKNLSLIVAITENINGMAKSSTPKLLKIRLSSCSHQSPKLLGLGISRKPLISSRKRFFFNPELKSFSQNDIPLFQSRHWNAAPKMAYQTACGHARAAETFCAFWEIW